MPLLCAEQMITPAFCLFFLVLSLRLCSSEFYFDFFICYRDSNQLISCPDRILKISSLYILMFMVFGSFSLLLIYFFRVYMSPCTGFGDYKAVMVLGVTITFPRFTFILCVWVFYLHVYKYSTYLQCPRRPEEGTGACRTGVRLGTVVRC